MKQKVKTIAGTLLTVAAVMTVSATASAQLHEQIEVEGNYSPEVILQSKINAFPESGTLQLPMAELPYQTAGVTADFSPVIYPMPASGWNTTEDFSDYRGYVYFGTGSWLNTILSAGLKFYDNGKSRAGLRLQHNSTSLWKPTIQGMKACARQFRYDEAIGLYGEWNFTGKGKLTADLDYSLGLFNYYGTFHPMSSEQDSSFPHQTSNQFTLSAGWLPKAHSGKSFVYEASFKLAYTSYRTLPMPALWNMTTGKGSRETLIEPRAYLGGRWGSGAAGVDAKLSLLFYGGPETLFTYYESAARQYTLQRPDNYGMLTLRPHYDFRSGVFDFRIGVDIDLTANAGEQGKRYSFFHIAPDLFAVYRNSYFTGRLSITGGSELNTLQNLRQQDYYDMPAIVNTRPSYIPFDATLEGEIMPFEGFKASAEIRFKVIKNVRTGGWYQAWVDYGNLPMPGLDGLTLDNGFLLYCLDREGINLHGVRIGGKIDYSLKKIFKIGVHGAWQPQNGTTGFFDGYDRPRVVADFSLGICPVEPLELGVNYKYRGVRRIYGREYVDPLETGGIINGETRQTLYSMRLPDLTLLDFSATWSFRKDFKVWLRADNLLNRHDAYLPLLPMQGINILAGLDWMF